MKLQILLVVAIFMVSAQQSEAYFWGYAGYGWPSYYSYSNYFSPYYSSLVSPYYNAYYNYGYRYGYGLGLGLRYFRDASNEKQQTRESHKNLMNHVHCTFAKGQSMLTCMT